MTNPKSQTMIIGYINIRHNNFNFKTDFKKYFWPKIRKFSDFTLNFSAVFSVDLVC